MRGPDGSPPLKMKKNYVQQRVKGPCQLFSHFKPHFWIGIRDFALLYTLHNIS